MKANRERSARRRRKHAVAADFEEATSALTTIEHPEGGIADAYFRHHLDPRGPRIDGSDRTENKPKTTVRACDFQ
jgi:hypothetical protein